MACPAAFEWCHACVCFQCSSMVNDLPVSLKNNIKKSSNESHLELRTHVRGEGKLTSNFTQFSTTLPPPFHPLTLPPTHPPTHLHTSLPPTHSPTHQSTQYADTEDVVCQKSLRKMPLSSFCLTHVSSTALSSAGRSWSAVTVADNSL